MAALMQDYYAAARGRLLADAWPMPFAHCLLARWTAQPAPQQEQSAAHPLVARGIPPRRRCAVMLLAALPPWLFFGALAVPIAAGYLSTSAGRAVDASMLPVLAWFAASAAVLSALLAWLARSIMRRFALDLADAGAPA